MTKEELQPMFNSNIKESPGREPKFRVKVDTTVDDQIKASVFDADKNSYTTKPRADSMQETRAMLSSNSVACIS